jgi:hypothetical protein
MAMTANPTTGSVHLVWGTKVDQTTRYGHLVHVARINGRWTQERQLARAAKTPFTDLSLQLTAAGHPIVGFVLPA